MSRNFHLGLRACTGSAQERLAPHALLRGGARILSPAVFG